MNVWSQADAAILWWLSAASLLSFAVSLLIVRLVVVRLPADYFQHHRRRRLPWAAQHPAIRILLLIGKNVLGATFLLLGILMLVLPGQGIITMLIGLMLLNFPGKYRFERWLVSRRPFLRAVNRVRARADRAPLVLDTGAQDGARLQPPSPP